MTALDKLIGVMESIQQRLESKEDRTPKETLFLVDVKLRLDVAKKMLRDNTIEEGNNV